MFDMFCCLAKKKSSVIKGSKYFHEINLRLKEQEINMLQLIYEDLSLRDVDNLINQENFLLFFNLNGLWGQKLFHEFDLDKSLKLKFDQFINGISKFIKATNEERIGTLFSTFEMSSFGGITYKEFLKMLYNYPKQELKNILNDQDFYNAEIKGHGKNYETGSKGSRVIDMADEPSEGSMSQMEQAQVGSPRNIQLPAFHKPKGDGTSLNFDIENRKVQVRSANINQLVKKFAANIFKGFGLDKKSGKINEQQFRDWISKHPKLYNSYFQGFHNYVWEYSNGQPLYMKRTPEKASDARIIYLKERKEKNVYVILLHTTMILFQNPSKKKPLHVVCLEGLAVVPTGDKGIEIKHRDGIYPEKQLHFASAELQQEWMELLMPFKGVSIQEKYYFSSQIGTGRFSVVFRAICNKSQEKAEEVAIKIIETFRLKPEEKNQIAHETSVMKLLNHPNIVMLIDTIQTKTHLYIVTQLAKGSDLFDYVQQNGYLREYDAAIITREIILAILYLNSLGMVHRDLKPQNIMVICHQETQEIERIKVIDFGFTNYPEVLAKEKTHGIVGTPNYMAPETLTRGDYNFEVDNFAIGVILFFMLRGLLPFDSDFRTEIIENTINCVYDLNDVPWKQTTPESRDIIKKFLVADPTKRLSLKDALNHEWFKVVKKDEKKKVQKQYLL